MKPASDAKKIYWIFFTVKPPHNKEYNGAYCCKKFETKQNAEKFCEELNESKSKFGNNTFEIPDEYEVIYYVDECYNEYLKCM